MRFDVFLSYTLSDRPAIVQPFLDLFHRKGLTSWCDIHEMRWEDSIIQKVQKGLADSRFLFSFISRSFLKKSWPVKELRSAMTIQVSRQTTVLPVLLGVSSRDLGEQIPFLAELRHVSIPDYNETIPVKSHELQHLVTELERAQDQFRPVKVNNFFTVFELRSAVKTASFNSKYDLFSAVTDRDYLELNCIFEEQRGRSWNVRAWLAKFLEAHCPNESADFHLCWHDPERFPSPVCVLPSGNVVNPHPDDLEHGTYDPTNYIKTGAPPHPCCVTMGAAREFILGYPDGLICRWNRELRLLKGHNSAIRCLDTSSESIIVSGDAAGNLGIWCRNSDKPLKMVQVSEDPVSALCVSRSGKAGIIATAGGDGAISIWSHDGHREKKLDLSHQPATHLAFFPNRLPCMAVARGPDITIVNYLNGEVVCDLETLGAPVTCLHVAAASRYDSLRSPPERPAAPGTVVTAGFMDGHVLAWRLRQ